MTVTVRCTCASSCPDHDSAFPVGAALVAHTCGRWPTPLRSSRYGAAPPRRAGAVAVDDGNERDGGRPSLDAPDPETPGRMAAKQLTGVQGNACRHTKRCATSR